MEAAALKILHIWSCAGISSLIAKYMDWIHGTESDVILTEKWDPLKLNRYHTTRMKSKPLFGLRALVMARKYDLIHVHYHSIFVPPLKFLYDKPVIIHFHGSDVRQNWGAHMKRIKRSDRILVSTKDLLEGSPSRAMWTPNPVDTVKFRDKKGAIMSWDKAFTFSYGADEESKIIARKFGLSLEIVRERIPYNVLDEFMRKFDYYIDIKKDFKGRILPTHGPPVLSKTGLEALSLGLRVIAKDEKIRKVLPECHRVKNVVDFLYEIYQECLRPYEKIV